ncbi:hypothetical protein EHP00_125 [Ecytonucleospora hepatopenaei]|uniref:Protein transport protein BOS1 n=1 Tax=Ecytonucleospora hepatopenaei TaxID=646526 RepID=A0A1W0E5U3_9MICR|nr:hypothetical protein EHP00_125 [Ecytonucleospora hepatopenaei]
MSQNFDNLLSKINEDLTLCEQGNGSLGSLVVKIRSFKNLLNKTNLDLEQKHKYDVEINNIIQRYKQVQVEKNKLKTSTQNELRESNLMVQRIDELTKVKDLSDKDFYASQNSKLDKIIGSGYDSLSNLKKQDEIIDGINSKLKKGLTKLGISNDLMEKIEKRTLGDKSFFYFMIFLLIFLMFLIKFVF